MNQCCRETVKKILDKIIDIEEFEEMFEDDFELPDQNNMEYCSITRSELNAKKKEKT